MMHTTVTIGPVATSSAIIWIGAAKQTLGLLREQTEVAVPDEVMAAFEHFVDAWSEHADHSAETFHWSDEVDVAVVRTIGLHWARIVSVTRSGRVPTLATAPPEAAAFYDAIATGIASALAAADEAPLADAFAEAVPAFDARPPEAQGASSIRVLIVDDHEDIRLLLRVWFEGDPCFEIAGEAGDGEEAIAVARTTRPDVAVVDVEMPRMSGIEAMPLIAEAVPDCAVVVFSSSDRESDALEAGAVAYVQKTAPIRSVVDAVRAAARHARR